MLKKGYSSDRVVAGKTYSTFVDNMSHSNSIDDNAANMSRKSSTASLQQQPRPLPTTMSSSSFNPKSLPSAPSTSSFQRHYAKPPVVPTTTSPLHHRENFVAGTGSYSRSFYFAAENVRIDADADADVERLKHLLLFSRKTWMYSLNLSGSKN